MIALAARTDRSWMADAACRGADDPNLWHPTAGLPSSWAIAVCNRCPVRERCADYAITINDRHGVWGGLTFEQRNRRAWLREVVRS
jgi:WhiB family redox-sensing transcriptional regulator